MWAARVDVKLDVRPGDGHLDLADFRAFTFDNPVALWAGTNPTIFDGTVIEAAVREMKR